MTNSPQERLAKNADLTKPDPNNRAAGALRSLIAGAGRQLSTILDLQGISDVTLSPPTNNQVLAFNGTSGQWENHTPILDDCSDVDMKNIAPNDVLAYNQQDSKWEPIPAPRFKSISKADYNALGTKEPGVLYLVHN